MSGIGLSITNTSNVTAPAILSFIEWLLDNEFARGAGDLHLSFARYDPETDEMVGNTFDPEDLATIRALIEQEDIDPLQLEIRYAGPYDRDSKYDNRTGDLIEDLNRVADITRQQLDLDHSLDFYGAVTFERMSWRLEDESGVSCNLSILGEGSPLGEISKYCRTFDALATENSEYYRAIKQSMQSCFGSPVELFFFDEGY